MFNFQLTLFENRIRIADYQTSEASRSFDGLMVHRVQNQFWYNLGYNQEMRRSTKVITF